MAWGGYTIQILTERPQSDGVLPKQCVFLFHYIFLGCNSGRADLGWPPNLLCDRSKDFWFVKLKWGAGNIKEHKS